MNETEQTKERNARVELDKAWETSWTRWGIIAAIAYTGSGLLYVADRRAQPASKRLHSSRWLLAFNPFNIGRKKWWITRYGK